MTAIAVFILISLAVLAIGQGVLVLGFARLLRQPSPALLPDNHCPKAAVILSLRGSDPFLTECLQAVLKLDYPNFVIHIIVDHAGDPVWQIVNAAMATCSKSKLQTHTLTEPLKSCSLKCSSLIQVVNTLDGTYDFVAQLDADTIPHRTWLRELATALNDPQVGAATGNRWYMPPDAAWGSLVRYFWNSAAIVQMGWYRIAWGGTLAIRTRVIREANLLEHWSKAFCEDTMLYEKLRPLGLQVKFLPGLLMVNRESSGLRDFFVWVTRQLLTARLYHPHWVLVAFHGLSTSLLMLSGLVVFLAALARQQMAAACWAIAAVIGFQLLNFVWLVVLERAARHPIGRRGESVAWIHSRHWARMPLAVLMTQAVYFAALCTALRVRVVKWRQVIYRLEGPWRIRLLNYLPWRNDKGKPDRSSL